MISQRTHKPGGTRIPCRISRFKLSKGHRKMSLLFSGSSQWEDWVTKTQLSVLIPSQHASLGRFTLPCSRSWYFILLSDGLLGHSLILAHWARGLQAWYLPLAKWVKLAIILLFPHLAWWKWYHSLRFTAVQGNTKGIWSLRDSQVNALRHIVLHIVSHSISNWNAAESKYIQCARVIWDALY